MELHGSTESVCPVEVNEGNWRRIEAKVWIDRSRNEVWMTKHCDRHGEFQDLISTDAGDYLRAERFAQKGTGVQHPVSYTEGECPTRCGLCFEHESKTVLAIIDVTNRCNMKCPVCFANAGTAGYLYEPTIDQIDKMLASAANVNFPKGIHAVQLSGGEPTVREDLPDIVRVVKGHGINHIEVNTNGLKVGDPERGPGYLKTLMDAGVSTLYLQFDGLNADPRLVARVPTSDELGRSMSEQGRKKLAEYYTERQLNVVRSAREAGFASIVLVVTLQRGVNDDQMGDILRYAGENSDVVRCVNFQPISMAGRMDRNRIREVRITNADVVNGVERQTGGQIKADDFYPIPVEVPLAGYLELVRGRSDHYDRFSAHAQCGRATLVYVNKKDGKVTFDPITRHMNPEKLYSSLENASGNGRVVGTLRGVTGIMRHTDMRLKRDMVAPILLGGNYKGTGDFMRKVLMIGDMHFMDAYNFDFQRVHKCAIHYIVPDERFGARVIPFCTMNNFHRPQIERALSRPLISPCPLSRA
ncbi:MAG TPA: radical SAM protein [Nitrososphaerales archaeon]|nr:radical SAM protein [Nitrososphaerales archaeon]